MSKLQPTQQTVGIVDIRLDGGTQARVQIDDATVKAYYEATLAYVAFPRIVVFFDGSDYWLADGFHRLLAFIRTHYKDTIECDVHVGGKRDALLYAIGANTSHGLRRTNEDKERAVRLLLEDGEWAKLSDVEIARAAAVTQPFVGNVKKQLITVISCNTRQTGRDGRTRRRSSEKRSASARGKAKAHGKREQQDTEALPSPATATSTPTETNVIGDLQSRVSSMLAASTSSTPSRTSCVLRASRGRSRRCGRRGRHCVSVPRREAQVRSWVSP